MLISFHLAHLSAGAIGASLVVNYDADCGEAAITRRGGVCCIRHAHYRSLPRRVAFVGTCAGSMKAITPAAALWGLMGLAGVAYVVIVARRIRTQSVYEPDFEDWLFRHTHCLRYPHSRLRRMRTRLCLALEQRRCCCSLLAFITPGTPSPTMYW